METKITRELGGLEKYCIRTRNVVVTIAEITGHNFDMQILKQALDAVVDLQPNLRINVDERDEPLKFKEVENPYIDPILIESDDAEEWKKVAFESVNDRLPINMESTLFKLEVLKLKNNPINKTYFFIKMNHANSDGTSGMIALNNILSYYSKFAGGEVREFNKVELLPNLEKLIFPSGVSQDDSIAINNILDELIADKRKKPTLVKPCEIENEENIHHALFEDGTEENFKKMRQFCKKEGVTVGNIIMAAYYFATAKNGYEHLKDENTFNLPLLIDVNLRDRLGRHLKKDHIALVISQNKIFMDFERETTFGDLIKKVNKKMITFFENRTFIHDIEVDRIVNENVAKKNPVYDGVVSPYFEADLNLSNIGAYPFNPKYKLKDGEIEVKSLKCIGSPWCPEIGHYVFLIHSVSYMNYSIVFCDSKNKEFAKGYMNSIIHLIENCHTLEKITFEEFLTI